MQEIDESDFALDLVVEKSETNYEVSGGTSKFFCFPYEWDSYLWVFIFNPSQNTYHVPKVTSVSTGSSLLACDV